VAPIAWTTVVTAYEEQRTVSSWARSRRCFVKPTAFHGRLVSLGTLEPHPVDVEAALCFDRSTWTFYRRHGYITEWHISAPIPEEDQWDAAEAWEDLALETESDPADLTTPIRSLPVKELHVLRMTIEGRSAYDISRALGLNPGTIGYYKTRVKKRLNIMTFRDWRLRHPDITALLYEETPLRRG
jgi:DNA-binding CsgD family transcriptional regulator